MIRQRPLSMLFLACLLVTSCGLDNFEETIQDEATIPGSFFSATPFALDFGGAFQNVDLSAQKEFQNQGVSPSDVDAILVKSVRIEGTDPQKDRLDVLLDSAEFFVEAPGQEKVSIARIDEFPMGSSADLMVVPNLNLKPYAVAPSMTVTVEVKLKQQPALSTTLRTTIVLNIDINLLGA